MPTGVRAAARNARALLLPGDGFGGLTVATRALALSLGFVALLVSVPSRAGAEDYREMRDGVSSRLATAEPLNDALPSESLRMSATLQLQHGDELDELIVAQQRPGSPEYHRWLSPEEFAARFGPAADTYEALAAWLRGQGFTVRTWPSRTRIDFSGAVGAVETAFRVRMNSYRRGGRRALANATPPLLPARFAASVQAVRLSTFRFAEPLVRVVTSSGSETAMGPHDIYTAYGVTSVLDRGITGTGQTIAIVARSDFNIDDVTGFQEQFGIPVHAPVKVFPAGNPGVGSPDGACAGIRNQARRQDCIFGEESEVLLDVEWAGALAPGATVLVDIADTDIDASLMHIVTHHPEAKIISISFGLCERVEPTMIDALEPVYAQAATQGQTVLVAAGNDGADACGDGRGASVNVLASSAEVTSVGGTSLDPGFDTSGAATGYVSEVVWNDSGGASGGGASRVVPKPAYQRAPGVPSDGFRDQPDVSFMASPGHAGYVMVIEDGVEVIGGTSAATPSWAAIVALVNQAAGRDGSGVVNPSLYALGSQQYSIGAPVVFHDITSGNNTFNRVPGFTAVRGFDLASGLGSPDVGRLVEALTTPADTPTPTATATPTPTRPLPTPTRPVPTPTLPGTTPTTPLPNECVGDCHGHGAVTVADIVTAVNISLGALPLTDCQSADADGDGRVTVSEVIQAVNHALAGC
jgi:subtilase family serine protease